MSHSMMGRNSPIVCPLASLGRASPSLDAQGYHHPLSSSPLDPQAYHQLSREFEDLDREDTPSPLDPHYHPYPRSRDSPFTVEKVYHRPTEQLERQPQQRKPPDQLYPRQINTPVEKIYSANKTSSPSIHSARSYHLSRSSSSSLDQPYITTGPNLLDPQVYYSPRGLNRPDQNYIQRSPGTFEINSQSRIANEQITARNKPRLSINDLEYRLSPNAFQHQGVQYHQRKSSDASYPMELRSPSLDSVYLDRYPANNNSHRECQYEASTERAYNYNPDYRPKNSRNYSARRTSSPDFDIAETRLVESFSKALRASPNLDQGYHTLVSPSPGPSTPGPWSDSNLTNTQTTVILKGKRLVSKCNFFERLPDDVALSIFQWLESFDLCQLAQVCKRFESLAWHPRLWSSVTLRGESAGERAARAIAARAGAAVRRLWVRDGCRLGPRALSLVARRCPDLTHLQLQGCATLTPQSLADLTARCTNLRHLDLTGCSRVSWCSVGEGADSPRPPPRRLPLQYLDMTDCPALSDAGLRAAVRACPQLEYLYLRRCVNITDAGLKFVPAYCSGLKELSVSDCIGVTDFGLYELAKLGAALRYLSVAKCTQVSDAGLKAIARRCYKLRYLNARGCEAVSDDSVCVLARAATRLRALDLGKCDVSDSGLRTLAESCPNLKKLSLRNCEMVTDRGVQCIAYYCRGLQQLNIQDCQITVEGYRAVKKYCKRCVIEHTNPGFC